MKRKQKLLVANRSEISCRVFQTAREMGLVAVGVVAPGDEEARHVSFCDELLEIPSYLDGPAIVAKALEAGVQFLHPGYGFLSERASFAALVEKSGISFLGPHAETIEAMDRKIPSKELAEKIGVPVLPWAKVSKGGDLKAAADRVGYPLLLKASSGGGGKGMRKVASAQELAEAIESAEAEALSAFGEGTVFLERLLENARHIEVQVFGDGKGGGVHLHERDCSLQRRHQKIWEEAHSPALNSIQRDEIGARVAKAMADISYEGVGTIEFLYENGEFYFIEMNTRLQVEHPVTEMITGLDLVQEQIRVASGAKLQYAQSDITFAGHAIECRINAENAKTFVPSPGRVDAVHFPGGLGVRVDSALYAGYRIPPYYDSLIGKLIVFGKTRTECMMRLKRAMGEFVIEGVETTIPLFQRLLAEPDIIDGHYDIHWLENYLARDA